MLFARETLLIPFRYPFRIFFLSAGMSGLLLIPLWLAIHLGGSSLPRVR